MPRRQEVQNLIDAVVALQDWAIGWSLSWEWQDSPSGYQLDVGCDTNKGATESLSLFVARQNRLSPEQEEAIAAEFLDDPIAQAVLDRKAAQKDVGNL